MSSSYSARYLSALLTQETSLRMLRFTIRRHHQLRIGELRRQHHRLGIDHLHIGLCNLTQHLYQIGLRLDKILGLCLNLRHTHKTIDNTQQFLVVVLYLTNELITVFLVFDDREEVGESYDGIAARFKSLALPLHRAPV